MTLIVGDLVPPRLTSLHQSDELRGYTRLRPQHGQPVSFVALLDGLKPVMVDRVPATVVDEYAEVCQARGLHVRPGPRSAGRGPVQVFVGHDRAAVDRALLTGGPAGARPWIDHYWYGTHLGYPPCCATAYTGHQAAAADTMPYQAWRSTEQPSAMCNSLLRASGLSWAAHLPCRYDCEATVAAAVLVRAAVRRHCLELADVVDQLTARPFLVLNDYEAFCFIGVAADPSTIVYQGVTLAPSHRPNLALFDALQRGSRVQVRDDLVVVFDGDDVTWVEQCDLDGPAPRMPVVLDFSADSW